MMFMALTLVLTSFSLAPVASADPSETATTTPATSTTKAPPASTPESSTSESTATTTKAPATTTTAPASESPATTTKAPSASTSKSPASTTSVAPTTAKRSAAVTPRGLNPKIDVQITDVQVEGKNGQQITVGDSVTVKGTWDASKADPQSGDEFTIKFPAELKLGTNPAFVLEGDDGTAWGTCNLVAATNVMTCVLTDAVTDRPEEVFGDFEVFTKAVEYTTSETIDFEINEKVVPVDLPGEGGISDGRVIGEATKSGKLQDNKQSVRWTIDIPGADLAALDTAGNGSVTLSDTLSSNMKLCEDAVLNAKLLSGRPGDLKNVPGGVAVTQPGGAGAVGITITNGAPFEKGKLYRVEYTSCTTSGEVDLPGEDGLQAVYDNSVRIGGTTVSAPGVGQDWRPKTGPEKSGNLLHGERYKAAEWTITVPGSFIETSPGKVVTIADTLGGNHAVCEEGLGLKVWRADRLPGPDGSGPKRTDVTGEFDIVSTAAAGAKDISVTITPKDAGKVDPKQYYYVTYRTCLTEDKVPDSGDVFTNTATVNGTPVKGSVKGPDFNGKKNGKINTDPREVAGEKQSAGTTMDWHVEIPGRHLEGRNDPAVITDTFSETMTVCEVSGDLKKNLNLKVIAKDFLGHSGVNAERDLTAGTTVTRTADGIDFTLPKEANDYSRETRYYIDYTLCTTSGGLDQRGTEYSNTLAYEGGPNLSHGVKQEWGGGGTGQGVARGSFSLLKQIDSSSEKFPEGTEFTVKVEEFAPGKNPEMDKPSATYNVKVKADGTPVSGFYPRGTGWQIRLSEIDLPTVDGVYFEQGTFRPADGVTLNADRTQALVTITPKSNVEVKLVNKAVLGSAKITKTVIGEALGALTGNEAFVVNAEIDLGDGSGNEIRPFTLTHGGVFDLKNLPIGAKVTFTEVQPTDTDRVTWSAPVIEPKTLIIGTDAAANTVSVTNEAKITQGTFELSKKLTGPEAFNKEVPKTFDVVATWTDANNVPQSKTLTLPSDGTAVPFGENLPGGTKITLTETVPANGNGLAYGVPAYTGDVTIGESGVVTIGKDLRKVEVVNFVDKNDGTLRILKQVEGEAAGEIGDDVEFTVEASWKDGVNYAKETLTVKKGVATPLNAKLPVGTEVTFTEVGRPDVAGVEWGTIQWGTDPNGESWLKDNGNGSVTGIVSDDPTEGRLITLTNEALWAFGSVEFTKYILDGDDPIPATEADLPSGAEFQVRIDGIDPALPAGTDFPAVGETITLNAGNGFSWKSGDVLPRNTMVTFSEVDPNPLPGIAWARPYYWVAEDAGDADYRNTVAIVPGDEAKVEIHNRPIPTTDVDIEKIVTGPKGNQVTKDPSTTFQVTATWTDVDDEARTCILAVKPGASVTPTAQCDAAVIDGRVQFPLDTEITFVETGAHTDVTNVKWGDVVWGVNEGSADVVTIDGKPTGVSVTLAGDAEGSVVLGLENKTSSNGLIIIPLPIPILPWDGSLIPPGSGSEWPTPPVSNQPGGPGSPEQPSKPGDSGHNGAPGKPAPTQPDQSPSLPVTGANVIWLAGVGLALIVGGAWLTLRNRRRVSGEG
ncbi:LPXTG cell wall anchor domain-containing protein [Rhodococcus sp. W8901]|nr:LPXTG cell wall anchor domain-containing protein [Rhodococcus sp. W8901]